MTPVRPCSRFSGLLLVAQPVVAIGWLVTDPWPKSCFHRPAVVAAETHAAVHARPHGTHANLICVVAWPNASGDGVDNPTTYRSSESGVPMGEDDTISDIYCNGAAEFSFFFLIVSESMI